MKIEAGKYYKTRDGRVAGPIRYLSVVNQGLYKFTVSTGLSYTEEGKLFTHKDSEQDLVAECDSTGNYLAIPSGVNFTIECRGGGGSGGSGGLSGPAGNPNPPSGSLIDRALAAEEARETSELDRMKVLPSAEERLERYKAGVAKLWEKGGLY